MVWASRWDFPVAGEQESSWSGHPFCLELIITLNDSCRSKGLSGQGELGLRLGKAELRWVLCLPLLPSTSFWPMCGRGEAFASFCKGRRFVFTCFRMEKCVVWYWWNGILNLPCYFHPSCVSSSWSRPDAESHKIKFKQFFGKNKKINLKYFCRLTKKWISLLLFRSKCWFEKNCLSWTQFAGTVSLLIWAH